MGERRMQVPFGELMDEVALVSGIPLETVEDVLENYSAAVARALAEGLIVEIAEGLRVQREEFFNRRTASKGVRLAINPNYELTRARGKERHAQQKEEHERAIRRFSKEHPESGE